MSDRGFSLQVGLPGDKALRKPCGRLSADSNNPVVLGTTLTIDGHRCYIQRLGELPNGPYRRSRFIEPASGSPSECKRPSRKVDKLLVVYDLSFPRRVVVMKFVGVVENVP